MVATSPAAATVTNSKLRDRSPGQAKWPRKKMNPLQVIGLLAVLVLCVSGFWRVSQQKQDKKMVKVLASAKDVPCGTKLGFMMLRYISIPVDLYDRDMVISLKSVVDRQCRTFLSAGEPIKKSSFFASTEGIAGNLKSDERAITLQLGEDELIDHAINPDDLVDIISICNKDGKKYVSTICQHARVLEAAPKAQLLARRLGGSNNKITLAVSPAMTEIVSEAAEAGKIRLVLRGRYNQVQEVLSGVGLRNILPDFVLKEESLAQARADLEKNHLAPPPPSLPSLLAAPAAPSQEPLLAAPAPGPIEWIVQMFSGSKKESLSVPQK